MSVKSGLPAAAEINILMTAAPRIEPMPAVWAAALAVFRIRQKMHTIAAEDRMHFLLIGGLEMVIFQIIVAQVAGIILPALGTFQRHHIKVCMIMPAAPRSIQILTVNFRCIVHDVFPFKSLN